MISAVSGSEMKKVDKYSIANIGIPSLVLMERAAQSVATEVKKICNINKKILVVCGTGNNGADGLAIARMLFIDEYNVSVMLAGDKSKATDEFKIQSRINKKLGIEYVQDADMSSYDCLVDAIFGIGLTRDVTGKFSEIVDKINNSGCKILSVDVPSGLCADTGRPMNVSVKADITVTFGRYKTGLLTTIALPYAGRIIVSEIGFPKVAYNSIKEYIIYDKTDLYLIPLRKTDSNKGSYGKVAVFAGSDGMSGAAFFSAMSAYRMGTGIVKIYTQECNREILQTIIPEALIETYNIDKLDIDKLRETINYADAMVVGPGVGLSDTAQKIVKETLKSGKPVVLDADALNIISSCEELRKLYHNEVIITPHMGEMSKLIGKNIDEIKKNSILECEKYAKTYGITCVLKDARTIISNGEKTAINMSGNSGMSTAGAGDVLTGIIVSLISQKTDLFKAASFGVFLHGMSGDIMSEKLSKHSLMATDIIDGIKYLTGDELNELR